MKNPTEEQRAEIKRLTLDLTALREFDRAALPAVSNVLVRLVETVDEARLLINGILDDFDSWPGPHTLRMRYFDRFGSKEDEPDWIKAKHAGIPPDQYKPQ